MHPYTHTHTTTPLLLPRPTPTPTLTPKNHLHYYPTVLAGLGVAAAGCLDFVDMTSIPKCYKGTFLCLGTEDDNCHLGENQLVMHVTDMGRDRRTRQPQVGIKLENEGMAASTIETLWVEDEYNLFRGLSPFSPIINSAGVRYHVIENSTVFSDALAHHVPFDQHFVASCVPEQKDLSLLRGIRRQAQPVDCVQNSGADNKHNAVTLSFETQCTVEEVELALSFGLLRVGVQMGGYAKKPVRKAFITCQDMLEVLPYDEDEHDRDIESFDFDEDEFWEEDEEWEGPRAAQKKRMRASE